MAAFVEGPCEVTLRSPPPLDTPMQVDESGDPVRLTHEGRLVAEARSVDLDLQPPEPPDWDQALAAQRRFPGLRHHDFPHCFTCGTARGPGDGLLVQTGAVEDRDLVAATWIPDASLADQQGAVEPEFYWAATDCAGAWATASRQKNPSLLGRFVARFTDVVRPGERCIVIGWPIGQDGRKHHAGTALFGADKRLIGCGRQTWLEIPRT
jgi:hypothetical protein